MPVCVRKGKKTDKPTENDIAKFRKAMDEIAENVCNAHPTIQHVGPDLWPKYTAHLREAGVELDPDMVSMPDYLPDGWREIRIPAEPDAVCTCDEWEDEDYE